MKVEEEIYTPSFKRFVNFPSSFIFKHLEINYVNPQFHKSKYVSKFGKNKLTIMSRFLSHTFQ